jgi:hypothetical protein
VFENRVLRRIFGPKRDEVTGCWRKIHNEKLHNLYSYPGIIRMIKSRRVLGRACSTHEKKMTANRILMGTPEGKRQIGRSRRRWVDNIKTNFRDTGWGGMDWIDLTQDRDQWKAFVSKVMNFRVALKCWEILE